MGELSDSLYLWKRPESIPYPNTWYKFRTKPKDGESLTVKIVDITPDRFEESIEFMKKHFCTDEPIYASLNIAENLKDLKEYEYALKQILDTKTSIMAVLDEDVAYPKIVGVQILYVLTKGDPSHVHFQDPGEKHEKVTRILDDLTNVDIYELLGTNQCFQGFGLCVKPEYRGMGIGNNILLSLEKLAKAYGVSGCMNMYSRIQSQVIAAKAGFKIYNEIIYKDYKDKKGEPVFRIEHTKSLKLMGIKYEL